MKIQKFPNRRWQEERRDCLHYYGDGGCLDQAARAELSVVPCRGCRIFATTHKPERCHG